MERGKRKDATYRNATTELEPDSPQLPMFPPLFVTVPIIPLPPSGGGISSSTKQDKNNTTRRAGTENPTHRFSWVATASRSLTMVWAGSPPPPPPPPEGALLLPLSFFLPNQFIVIAFCYDDGECAEGSSSACLVYRGTSRGRSAMFSREQDRTGNSGTNENYYVGITTKQRISSKRT